MTPAHNAESDAPIRCVVCNVNSEGSTYLAFIHEHADHCRGCSKPVGSGSPTPDHCGECPPWTCDGCGQPCSMADPCACWISLEGMAMADIKGLLALGDISVTPPVAGQENNP